MSSPNFNNSTVSHNENRSANESYDVYALQEPSTFSSGYVLEENFRLEHRLGRGGMGETWKAYDQTADQFVVLKFIPKEIQHVQETMDLLRFLFKKVHALQHQHICPVYGLFTNSQHGLYLAMKYIDGVSLDVYRRKYLKKHGKILFSDIVQILWGMAKGLDYAHEKKVLHRDIKPQNVMIGKSDGVQIIDFGLAEEIRTSMAHLSRESQMSIAGTRHYMAPEQWRGRLQDARTDQYALAVTAYEMFSGHAPFLGNDIVVLRESVLKEEPAPIAELPEYVNTALLKALSKRQEDRYENCRAFIKAMITKPQESENAETTVDEILPDKTNTEQKDRWLPPVTFLSSESSSVVQKAGTQIKNIKPFWFILTAIFAMMIIGAGFFLMPQTRRPTVEPVNVEPLVAKPPKIEQNIIEPKQPVDNPPEENITEEPAVNKTIEKELLKATEFKNGYLPDNQYQNNKGWAWQTHPENQVTLTNNDDSLVVNLKKRGKDSYLPMLHATDFSL
ncbi:MAG: serine/threonine protein kinase, partial [Planctomycetaceae bacterium]|nr:serine/threonine protein kinase [Planctomycetaceae bacterium]